MNFTLPFKGSVLLIRTENCHNDFSDKTGTKINRPLAPLGEPAHISAPNQPGGLTAVAVGSAVSAVSGGTLFDSKVRFFCAVRESVREASATARSANCSFSDVIADSCLY